MATIERAVAITATAHAGQRDKAGAPYLLHPLRMMMRMTNPAAMMAAVLHDVVEDTDWTLDQLRAEGFNEEVLAAVDCLTNRAGESYDEFIVRVQANEIARQVKRADLEDNMDIYGTPQKLDSQLRCKIAAQRSSNEEATTQNVQHRIQSQSRVGSLERAAHDQ